MAATKTPLTEEQKLRRRAGRTIARTMWKNSFRAENPEASKEETKAAWLESRKAYTKIGMRALRALEADGFKLETASDTATA